MTLVEFFEKDAIENICSSLIKKPDRVVLLGDNKKRMEAHAERYQRILRDRGNDVAFIPQLVDRSSMQTIVDALSSVAQQYDDCVFDLTGGDDLFLVAAGIVAERYKDRNIQMHRLNLRNNSIVDVDQDGKTILESEAPALSVEENIRIYGGDIDYFEPSSEEPCTLEKHKKDTKKTIRWDMNEDFRQDINAMWEICRKNPGWWNKQISVLEEAESLNEQPDALTVTVPIQQIRDAYERSGREFKLNQRFIERLRRAGLLCAYTLDDDTFSVTFKDAQVKRCLTVEGQALEMKVFLIALEAQEKDDSKSYQDVMNGVVIDWDGEIHDDATHFDTENEIDVVMMHGMIPVFVSCKNGSIKNIGKDELYKLDTVATRFGGKYAKKVLIATSLNNSPDANYLRQRAKDMQIRLVEGTPDKETAFVDMTDEQLQKLVRTFWNA